MKIFVVDDDPFAQRLLVRQLETIGHSDVVVFSAAKEPLAILGSDVGAAEVIVLDLAMPDMDGMEFIQQLARLKFSGTLIFVSGMDERILQLAPMLATGLHLKVAGALKKPGSPEQLRALLSPGAPQ
jgi:CheY-like chemotaxis protein